MEETGFLEVAKEKQTKWLDLVVQFEKPTIELAIDNLYEGAKELIKIIDAVIAE